MSLFSYSALDREGRRRDGTIPAPSRAAAMDAVTQLGLMPLEIQQHAEARAGSPSPLTSFLRRLPGSRRVPASALDTFTRELANLLAAGLPLSRALHLLRREAAHPMAREVWGKVHDDVVGGKSLADAMLAWPAVFSSVYVAMVRAGETGGFLHVVLQQIADFRTREQELTGKVKAALIYPCVLAVVATGVLIFLLTYFIPRFSGIFAEFGADLPLLTRAIVAVSHWLLDYGWLIAVLVVAGGFSLKQSLQTRVGRRAMERAMLRAPVVGKVAARFALVRFTRMLGTLSASGVPLVAALRVARETLGNQTLADAVSSSIEQVQRGTPLSRSLAGETTLFPPTVIEMIAISEETGRLDKELIRMSVAFESELERNLRMLVALAEPAMLFVMASVIGTVVVGMLLPVFTLQDLIK